MRLQEGEREGAAAGGETTGGKGGGMGAGACSPASLASTFPARRCCSCCAAPAPACVPRAPRSCAPARNTSRPTSDAMPPTPPRLAGLGAPGEAPGPLRTDSSKESRALCAPGDSGVPASSLFPSGGESPAPERDPGVAPPLKLHGGDHLRRPGVSAARDTAAPSRSPCTHAPDQRALDARRADSRRRRLAQPQAGKHLGAVRRARRVVRIHVDRPAGPMVKSTAGARQRTDEGGGSFERHSLRAAAGGG